MSLIKSRHYILNKNLVPNLTTNIKDNLHQIKPKSDLSFENDNLYYSEFEYSENLALENTKNQFLNTFLVSYNNHLSLVIRPDDIHIALQLIFSTAISNNAEILRSKFVDFDGKRNLTIRLDSFDSQMMFELFDKEIRSNIIDETFVDKYISEYTTTTPIITNATRSLLMNSFKEYFTYTMILSCGIPEVILEGTEADWDRLQEFYLFMRDLLYQTELGVWFDQFDNVMKLFDSMNKIKSDSIDLSSTDIAKMWSRVITYTPYGSGGDQLLGGWIRLFFPFDTNKKIIDGIKNQKSKLFDLDSEPKESSDYYHNQDILKEFYMSSSENEIPQSLQQTKLEIILETANIKFESEIVSGFYQPYIRSSEQTSDNVVRFNVGTIIRKDSDLIKKEQMAEYNNMGIYMSDSRFPTVKIPRRLKYLTGQIMDTFDATSCEYYISPECAEYAKERKIAYEKLGLYLITDNNSILLAFPHRFGAIYKTKSETGSGLDTDIILFRKPKSSELVFDMDDVKLAFGLKAHFIKTVEYVQDSYEPDEYDKAYNQSEHKNVYTICKETSKAIRDRYLK